MELEKNRNHKFNFFKPAYRRQSLGFSNLKDANDYTTLLVVSLWIISGMFFKMDMRNQPVQVPPPVVSANIAENPVDSQGKFKYISEISVATNSIDAQEKLKFISQVRNLKSASSYKENSSNLLKEINKDLRVVVTSFDKEDNSFQVQGYMLDSKKKVELSFEDETIGVKWVNVTSDEVELFANAWKGNIETETRLNNKNQKETVLTANILRIQTSPTVILPSQKIQALEAQLEKLKQENADLKKNNANLAVKQAIKDNPHLKPQEQQIQKFVDSFMEASKK